MVALASLGFGASFLVFGGGHTVANAAIGNFGFGVSMAASQIAGTALRSWRHGERFGGARRDAKLRTRMR